MRVSRLSAGMTATDRQARASPYRAYSVLKNSNEQENEQMKKYDKLWHVFGKQQSEYL